MDTLTQWCWTCLRVSVHTPMKARPDVHHHLLPLIIVSKEGIMKDFSQRKDRRSEQTGLA